MKQFTEGGSVTLLRAGHEGAVTRVRFSTLLIQVARPVELHGRDQPSIRGAWAGRGIIGDRHALQHTVTRADLDWVLPPRTQPDVDARNGRVEGAQNGRHP
jgi:hypothetical protein